MKISKTYLLALPRIGMSLIYVWFGYQQLKSAMAWIGYIPQSLVKMLPISATTFIHINGAVEVVFGFALMFGICTRLSSFILGFHLLDIAYTIGLDSTGVRDFGIVMGTFYITIFGPDDLCLDRFIFGSSESTDIPERPMVNYNPSPVFRGEENNIGDILLKNTPIAPVPPVQTEAPVNPTTNLQDFLYKRTDINNQ